MPIMFNDPALESQIEHERDRRSDATKAKTTRALIAERLREIELDLKRGDVDHEVQHRRSPRH